jgi:hypothetical protein
MVYKYENAAAAVAQAADRSTDAHRRNRPESKWPIATDRKLNQ